MDSLKNDSDCSTGGGGLSEKNNLSFNRLCENMLVGVAIVDNDGNCLQVNSKLREMLGYSGPELLGTGFRKLIWPGGTWADPRFRNKNSLENLRIQDEEKCCFKKDGSEIRVRISTFFRIDPENRPIYIVFYIEDINRQKEAENSFAASGREFFRSLRKRF
ncbi:PAS domain-containing protein [Methanosarcina sp. T3]|uniref:PAS domain-containing protein n=1 Tax=Methanosarcina sp. T3 TaxID=3439062 RepID=UPI003F8331D1